MEAFLEVTMSSRARASRGRALSFGQSRCGELEVARDRNNFLKLVIIVDTMSNW